MNWTITSDNYSAATLAAASIAGLRITLENGLTDSATFWVPGEASGTAPFEEKEGVSFAQSGGTKFTGYVHVCEPRAQGSRQGWAVTVHGQGQMLSNAPYLQTVPVAGGTAALGTGIVLGLDGDGERETLAQTLVAILTDSAARTGCTAGTVLTDFAVSGPLMECRDFRVREALNAVLRWVPDAVVWLDHSTGAIHIQRPALLSTQTRAGSGNGSGVSEVNPQGRRRKAVDGVIITWITTSVVDGVATVTPTQYTAGDTSGGWVASVTIDLAGRNLTIQEEEPVVGSFPSSAAEAREFILAHWPEIAAANPLANQLELVSVSQEIDEATHQGLGDLPETSYPRYLIAGNVPVWQDGISSASLVYKLVFKAGSAFGDNPALSKLFSGSEQLLTLTHHFVGTDAQSIRYTHATGSESGEVPIAGLAEAWFDALGATAPAGTWRHVGEDVDTALRPGRKLTLTGPFAQTGGVIQAVTWDIDRGETLVTYGPQSRLTPADLVELARAGRASNVVNVPGSVRTSAEAQGRKIKSGVGAVKAAEIARPVNESGWFCISQAGPTAVKIGAGCLHTVNFSNITPTWTDVLNTPLATNHSKSVFAEASGPLTVANGDRIWAKVLLEDFEEGQSELRFFGMTEEADGEGSDLKVTVKGGKLTMRAAYGLQGYVAAATQPADITTGTRATYVCIGEVAIVGGVMDITQGQTGAINVPPLMLLMQENDGSGWPVVE